ncbi:major capsid protein P2 [Thalassotalea castellviae]|uniref:Major capsid protein P2 n=1 Tax=Thalassotalea castellviae TaxID=3075612 RepID=A0ABU2ZZY4_9GAMM|nr:major capsid protein P2 [Thalassotalea sp. W431]MDT0603492.1 major capsid protein P2 [Thalassotalea sp. W431]
MSRNFRQLPSISNVVAGSKASLLVPLGFTYDIIKLKYSGVTLAQIEDIEVRIGSKPIQRYKDGERLNDINKYYGRNVEAGVLTLWFIRPEWDNKDERRMTAIGTADISSFDIQFKINAAAVAPVVTAYAVRSLNTPLGLITKVKDFPMSSATSGIQEIDNIPKQGRIAAIHSFKSDVSKSEVTVNSAIFNEFEKGISSGLQTDHKRVPNDAKHTTVDFLLEGDWSQSLIVEGVNDFRIRNTLDTSGATDVVIEYLAGIQGI